MAEVPAIKVTLDTDEAMAGLAVVRDEIERLTVKATTLRREMQALRDTSASGQERE